MPEKAAQQEEDQVDAGGNRAAPGLFKRPLLAATSEASPTSPSRGKGPITSPRRRHPPPPPPLLHLVSSQ